jgi:hypothetical protein
MIVHDLSRAERQDRGWSSLELHMQVGVEMHGVFLFLTR